MNFQAFILPAKENRELMRLLSREYINEDFQTLMQHLSQAVGVDHTNNQAVAQQVIVVLNNLFLMNVYKYLTSRDQRQFVFSTTTGMFASELHVEQQYYIDVFRGMVHQFMPEEDLLEAENIFSAVLQDFMVSVYLRSSDSYNEVFYKLFSMFQEQVPYEQITPYRFELTPQLAPMLLYRQATPITGLHP